MIVIVLHFSEGMEMFYYDKLLILRLEVDCWLGFGLYENRFYRFMFCLE